MSVVTAVLSFTLLVGPSPLPKLDPAKSPVDGAALKRLLDEARAPHSEALVVLYDGKVLVDERFGRPPRLIEAMSATKSVVSLAVGLLLDEGKIPSLDEP